MEHLKLIELTAAVSASCPIDGISVSSSGALRVDYKPEASPEQQSTAQAVIAAYDFEAPPVPQSVTPYQARMALTSVGLRAAAETAISNASQDVQDAWEYALTIERSSPFIAAVGGALGLSDQQIDALFIAAAQI